MEFKLYGRGETADGYEYTRDTIGRMYGHEEECACDECGEPLYVGDRALMVEDGTAYCSDTCMEKQHGQPPEYHCGVHASDLY